MTAANRIEAMADGLAQTGRVDALESELQKFNPQNLAGVERESWYHLWGIAAFRRGDRARAFHRFLEARDACPDSGVIAFSLGQEHEGRGEPELMLRLFDGHRFPKVAASYALAQARYAYLWNDLARAISYIEPIIDAYWKLRILDTTFLYLRGLPFFDTTWDCLGAFLELDGRLDELEERTKRAAAHFSGEDLSYALRWVRAVRNGDFSEYVKDPRRGTAFERTRAAILLTRKADYATAVHELGDVRLTDDDPPWLKDLLLEARCAAAQRSGSADEAGLVEDLLQRQPLLFEPNHAFDFRLLDYQEILKDRYRQNRRRAPAR